MGGGWFGKHKEVKVENKAPAPLKVETGVLLVMYEGGAGVNGVVDIKGVEMNRKATTRDMYAMVCQIKAVIESNMTAEALSVMLRTPPPAPKPVIVPEPKPETESPK